MKDELEGIEEDIVMAHELVTVYASSNWVRAWK
jgi:hypothetical protein